MGKKPKAEPEEIVEMKEDTDGKFHAVVVVNAEDRSVARNDAVRDLPRWFPVAYEVINGFTIGLGAIENFMMNMRKINRRRKNVNLD